MSWIIKKIGKREAVKIAVEKEQNIPSTVKACILSVLKQETNTMTGVRVEGHGHEYTGEGSYYSSIGKLEIEPFHLTE